jgi:hypothetical protein
VKARKVIVPIALAVGIVSAATAITTTSTGCGNDEPRADAGLDSTPDTPII